MDEFIAFDESYFAEKNTLISYFNEEQLDELLNLAIGLLSLPKQDVLKVALSDIGKTGLLLNVVQSLATHTYFLPFAQALDKLDDLQQQYILLLQKSAKILGKISIELKKRQFTLLEKYNVTAHIVRLVLQSEQDLSHLPTGYAFLLKTEVSKTEIRGETQSRAVRYYTLRKAWQELDPQGKIQNLAWIDVYCHGEKNGELSLGERWVKLLNVGDIVTSEREFPEKIDHLAFNKQGKPSLLIADETSLPTVVRLLEVWQNPLLPIVIVFVQNEGELAYLNDGINENFAPHSLKILPVIANITQTPHEQIFVTLSEFLQNNPSQIASVWGGLEATTTKILRPLLCDRLDLTRENMVLKVYWRNYL